MADALFAASRGAAQECLEIMNPEPYLCPNQDPRYHHAVRFERGDATYLDFAYP